LVHDRWHIDLNFMFQSMYPNRPLEFIQANFHPLMLN
jgi:hypothetical protein